MLAESDALVKLWQSTRPTLTIYYAELLALNACLYLNISINKSNVGYTMLGICNVKPSNALSAL